MDKTPPGFVVTAATESWNGTSWTEVNDLNDCKQKEWELLVKQTAGLIFGGKIQVATDQQKQNLGMEQVGQKLMI